jgi:hypothetical protein
MTDIKHRESARERGKPISDGVARRVSSAIAARRRLGPQRPPGESSASWVGPRDPRYTYLAEPHD